MKAYKIKLGYFPRSVTRSVVSGKIWYFLEANTNILKSNPVSSRESGEDCTRNFNSDTSLLRYAFNRFMFLCKIAQQFL